MNKVIKYIEKHLDSEIEMKELSKIVLVNDFIFGRVFSFVAGISLKEYIKLRRLSKAYEEIKNTNNKIIDIALKYQYNSATSFTRSFKNYFGLSPMECRKSKKTYKIYPILSFKPNITYSFDYEIKEIKNKTLYVYEISSDNINDYHYEIRKLYKKIKANGDYEKFNQRGMYGISSRKNNTYIYYLGSTLKNNQLKKYKINNSKYVIFKLDSRKQQDIVELEKNIYKVWLPSTNYNLANLPKIEYYEENCCYIYVAIN